MTDNNIDTSYTPESLFYRIDPPLKPFSDFLIRLDLLGCLACDSGQHIDTFLRQNWSMAFRSIPLTQELENACVQYFKDFRIGYKLLSRQTRIQSKYIIIRTLIYTAILKHIAACGSSQLDLKEIKNSVADFIKEDANMVRDCDADANIDEILSQYFKKSDCISLKTKALLEQYRENISEVCKKLCKEYCLSTNNSAASDEKKTSSDDRSRKCDHTLISVTPLQYIKIVCLEYLAIKEHNETGCSEKDAIRAKWNNIYHYSSPTNADINEVLTIIDQDPSLRAAEKLFRYPLIEIRNGKLIRTYVIALCVHTVISKLPHHSTKDRVVEEAVAVFSKFQGLSAGLEEEDVEKYVSRFVLDSGTVDERISTVLWEYVRLIEEFFNSALDSVNSEDSARIKPRWEALIQEKDKQFSTLQGQLDRQIDTTKANTIFSLVQSLSSPSYNYLLSRLYRFAYGIDSPSESDLRTYAKNLIQIFQVFGVMATNTDAIGRGISNAEDDGLNFARTSVPDLPDGQIVFPGWRVYGDVVVFPIGSEKEEQ